MVRAAHQNLVFIMLFALQVLCSALSLGSWPGFAFLPIGLIVCAACFLWPHLGIIVLVVSWYFPTTLLQTVSISFTDLISLAVIAGYASQSLVRGQIPLRPTPLNWWIYLLMGALLLSATQAMDVSMSLRSWLRHGQLFLLFFAVVGTADFRDIRRALGVIVGLCLVLSLWNIHTFLSAAGMVRAFGPAHVYFSGLLALAGTFAVVGFLLAGSSGARVLWGLALAIMVAGQLANQSRGAMIQLFSGIAFALLAVRRWSRVHQRPYVNGRIKLLLGCGLVVILVVAFLASPLTEHVVARYESFSGSRATTVEMRQFLWKSGLTVFQSHPLLGIGLGQHELLVEILPAVRFNPWFLATEGLGFHNSVISYLAETGIVGSVLLAVLLLVALDLGRGIVRNVTSDREAIWQIGVWSIVFVIVSRYLYEDDVFRSISGVQSVTFFGFLLLLRDRRASLRDTAVVELQ